jgi:hypothetical protein
MRIEFRRVFIQDIKIKGEWNILGSNIDSITVSITNTILLTESKKEK